MPGSSSCRRLHGSDLRHEQKGDPLPPPLGLAAEAVEQQLELGLHAPVVVAPAELVGIGLQAILRDAVVGPPDVRLEVGYDVVHDRQAHFLDDVIAPARQKLRS